EPDLLVTQVQVPSGVMSGQTIPVTFAVKNQGTRDTREDGWTDRLFLSGDPSLDNKDLVLGSAPHSGGLKVGESYTTTVNVRLPDGIGGDFYLLVYADTAAKVSELETSDIGLDLRGVGFQSPSPLAPWDLVSEATRKTYRGAVPEFGDEGNNIFPQLLPITLATPPDLQV